MKTLPFGEYGVFGGTMDEAVAICRERSLNEDGPLVVACMNPHCAAVAEEDGEYAGALRAVDLLLPDGIGVVWALSLLGTPCAGRLTGPDLFLDLSRVVDRSGGGSYGFLGSTPEVLGLIEERMAREFPRIKIVASISPPFAAEFSSEIDDDLISRVNAAAPDFLWVGMTAPKQEKWIERNRGRLRVPVAAAVGASFDFFAGTVSRPGKAWQALGLEWLPRLAQSPGRLWRRTFVSGPVFARHVARLAARRYLAGE